MRCEMGGTIETALRLSRKMLTVDAGLMDRNPWLLNVQEPGVWTQGRVTAAARAEISSPNWRMYRGLDHVCGTGSARRADRR